MHVRTRGVSLLAVSLLAAVYGCPPKPAPAPPPTTGTNASGSASAGVYTVTVTPGPPSWVFNVTVANSSPPPAPENQFVSVLVHAPGDISSCTVQYNKSNPSGASYAPNVTRPANTDIQLKVTGGALGNWVMLNFTLTCDTQNVTDNLMMSDRDTGSPSWSQFIVIPVAGPEGKMP